MRLVSATLLLIAGLLFIGIFIVWSRLSPSNYAAAVENGRAEIELVRDFDNLFQDAEHFISYYPRGGDPSWNAKIGLHQRYVLTMKFDITFDFARRHPKPTDKPQFYLLEVDEIKGLPNGRIASTYTSNQYTFGIEEWIQLRNSGGDFSAIGIDLKKTAPIKGFEDIWIGL